MSIGTARQHALGDHICHQAQQYADRVNQSELAISCRNLTLPKVRYQGYVAAMYPIVVGFNRALIRSIAKVDHVREHRLVKYLCEQLQEEQDHNAMWRRKMEELHIDHEALYLDLENYLAKFSDQQLDNMTEQVLEAARIDITKVTPGAFPDPVVPEPVLALYHYLYKTAIDPAIHYWEHFACQTAVECIIYSVVSESVYPGVSQRKELNPGRSTLIWWKEHARQGSEDGEKRTDEEKHLEMARLAMNRSEKANQLHDQILSRAEDAMRLFAGTAICHDQDYATFTVTPYL